MTAHHNDQRQIWISERHRNMLKELARDEQRHMRVVAERLIAEAHGRTFPKKRKVKR